MRYSNERPAGSCVVQVAFGSVLGRNNSWVRSGGSFMARHRHLGDRLAQTERGIEDGTLSGIE